MKSEFMFAGYQLRVAKGVKLPCTLADNINPLYIPNLESLRSEFEIIMDGCEVPFLITNESNLWKLIELSRQDLYADDTLLVLRCAILKSDSRTAYTEFYDRSGKLNTISFRYLSELSEPNIEFIEHGYDVIDTTIGGGFDSAIHTYQLYSGTLNESGLLASVNAAVDLRNYAGNELSDHGPFSVWSVGTVKI